MSVEKALYEIANSIDRLTLVLGRAVALDLDDALLRDEEGYSEEELDEREFGGFVDSSLVDAVIDAENAIFERAQKGIEPTSHICDAVRNG